MSDLKGLSVFLRMRGRRSGASRWTSGFSAFVMLTAFVFIACPQSSQTLSAPPGLAEVPPGQGRPYTPRPLLRVRDRALILPSGESCPETGACPALQALRGQSLAVEFEAGLLVAELARPLRLIAELLEPNETLCLRVSSAGHARCLDVRPRPAEALGDWMDADKPLAKIRLMVRADGMEIVTVRGKIPGPDRYGPSVPTKGGGHDFDLLVVSLSKLAIHLSEENEAALLASPQTTAQTAARALGALGSASKGRFEKLLFIL